MGQLKKQSNYPTVNRINSVKVIAFVLCVFVCVSSHEKLLPQDWNEERDRKRGCHFLGCFKYMSMFQTCT